MHHLASVGCSSYQQWQILLIAKFLMQYYLIVVFCTWPGSDRSMTGNARFRKQFRYCSSSQPWTNLMSSNVTCKKSGNDIINYLVRFCLYVTNFCWTLAYFTKYTCMSYFWLLPNFFHTQNTNISSSRKKIKCQKFIL